MLLHIFFASKIKEPTVFTKKNIFKKYFLSQARGGPAGDSGHISL